MHNKNVAQLLMSGLLALVAVPLAAQVPAALPPVVSTNVAPPPVGVPKIQFATTTFEFGRAAVGTVVRATFVLTNTGTAPLEIPDVRPGCGCTTAGTWDRRVEPGKTTMLALQLNTAAFAGPIIKTATVTCNDPAQPTTVLLIKGEVWKPVEVQPTIAMFSLFAEQSGNDTRSVRVINNTEQDMTIEEPTCSHPAFKATLKVIRPGKEFEFQVVTVPPLPLGTVQGTVTAKTSFTNFPVITFQTLATVQPALTATPGEVVLPAGPLGGPTQVTVAVRNNSPEPITISDPSLTVSNATVNLTQVQPGRFYNLALSFPAGFQLKPGEPGELAFKTSNPRIPLMHVPIRVPALVQPPSPLALPN